MTVSTPPRRRAMGFHMPIGELRDTWGEDNCHTLFDRALSGEFDGQEQGEAVLFLPSQRPGGVHEACGDRVRPPISQAITTSQSPERVLEEQLLKSKQGSEISFIVDFLRATGASRYGLEDQVWVHFNVAQAFAEEFGLPMPAYWKPSKTKQRERRANEARQALKAYCRNGGELPPALSVSSLLLTERDIRLPKRSLRAILKEARQEHPNPRLRVNKGGQPRVGKSQQREADLRAFLQA